MTEQDENIIDTIRTHRRLMRNSITEDYGMHSTRLGGIVDGLGLVLDKEKVEQLYKFAIKLDEK